VVAELAQFAPDDRAYLERLARVVGQVSAAKQVCVVLPQAGSSGETVGRVVAVWPSAGKAEAGGGGGSGVGLAPVEFEREVKQAALSVLESSPTAGPSGTGGRAFSLEEGAGSAGLYDGTGSSGKGMVLAVPVPEAGGAGGAGAGGGASGDVRVVAAITMLVDSRSKAAVQSTLAMAEVLAGYVHGHAARSELKRQQAGVMALELATRLLSAVNAQPSFKGAALQLVNDLTRQLGADRAALGWVTGSTIDVVALSDAEHFNKRTELVRSLAGAMEECLDQEQAVCYPAPEASSDVLLGQAIVAAHKDLVERGGSGGGSSGGGSGVAGLVAVSVPLRRTRAKPEGGVADETVGVLTLELRSVGGGKPIDVRGVEMLQAAADLLGPVMATRRSDDRLWALRTVDSTRRAGAWLVGPRHTWWKIAAALATGLVLFCALFKIEHRVGSMASLEATGKRVIAAPLEGVVTALGAGVRPGAEVQAGQMLAELDTRELELQLAGAMARREQAERQMANARRDGKVAEAQVAQASMDKAMADAALVRRRIELSRLTSPIAGVIVAGDLKDKLGAAVKAGDNLMQVAPLGELYVVAKVDERDVGLIKAGGEGVVRFKGDPSRGHAVTIETIVPLAVAREGKNEFEVRAKLAAPEAWMRPGMEGVARLDAGRRSLLWIGTRRVFDTVRLWLW
jgi:biotin carboxyl carrier protein